jgi:parallel beta-helix repeat protein
MISPLLTSVSESHNNEIYNNTVSDSGRGIDLDKASYGT